MISTTSATPTLLWRGYCCLLSSPRSWWTKESRRNWTGKRMTRKLQIYITAGKYTHIHQYAHMQSQWHLWLQIHVCTSTTKNGTTTSSKRHVKWKKYGFQLLFQVLIQPFQHLWCRTGRGARAPGMKYRPAGEKVVCQSLSWRKCFHLGVSKNRATPKWMVYNGKPCFLMDDLGVPLFLETSILVWYNEFTWVKATLGFHLKKGAPHLIVLKPSEASEAAILSYTWS